MKTLRTLALVGFAVGAPIIPEGLNDKGSMNTHSMSEEVGLYPLTAVSSPTRGATNSKPETLSKPVIDSVALHHVEQAAIRGGYAAYDSANVLTDARRLHAAESNEQKHIAAGDLLEMDGGYLGGPATNPPEEDGEPASWPQFAALGLVTGGKYLVAGLETGTDWATGGVGQASSNSGTNTAHRFEEVGVTTTEDFANLVNGGSLGRRHMQDGIAGTTGSTGAVYSSPPIDTSIVPDVVPEEKLLGRLVGKLLGGSKQGGNDQGNDDRPQDSFVQNDKKQYDDWGGSTSDSQSVEWGQDEHNSEGHMNPNKGGHGLHNHDADFSLDEHYQQGSSVNEMAGVALAAKGHPILGLVAMHNEGDGLSETMGNVAAVTLAASGNPGLGYLAAQAARPKENGQSRSLSGNGILPESDSQAEPASIPDEALEALREAIKMDPQNLQISVQDRPSALGNRDLPLAAGLLGT